MKRMAIFLDGSPNDGESLLCAVQVCRACDGRLTVIHPRQPDQYVPAGVAGIAPVVVDNREQAEAAAAAARQAYDRVCADLAFTEWQETTVSGTDAIAGYGLVHDLTILERVSSEQGPEALAFNTALFDTGGPVLVVPPNAPAVVGRHIAVAWAARIPPARAVRAAMPLIRQARTVTVVTNRDNVAADPAALVAYLACHGIDPELRNYSGARMTARGRGRAMLAAVAETSADLLVMGAYGENRLTALLGLGRATRKVVTAAPIPLLIQS